jgi:hypothetical protein
LLGDDSEIAIANTGAELPPSTMVCAECPHLNSNAKFSQRGPIRPVIRSSSRYSRVVFAGSGHVTTSSGSSTSPFTCVTVWLGSIAGGARRVASWRGRSRPNCACAASCMLRTDTAPLAMTRTLPWW